jgi:hypothetical protein
MFRPERSEILNELLGLESLVSSPSDLLNEDDHVEVY